VQKFFFLFGFCIHLDYFSYGIGGLCIGFNEFNCTALIDFRCLLESLIMEDFEKESEVRNSRN
jgi:hypothetical protein